MNYEKCSCAQCGQSIEYPSEGTGETVPCPTCGKPITLAPANPPRDASGSAGPIETRLQYVERTGRAHDPAWQRWAKGISKQESHNIFVEPVKSQRANESTAKGGNPLPLGKSPVANQDRTLSAGHRFPPEPQRSDLKYQAWDNAAGREYGYKLDHLRWEESVKHIKAQIEAEELIQQRKLNRDESYREVIRRQIESPRVVEEDSSAFIPPTPEQLAEIHSFGKEAPPGLTYQEAAIWIEQCRILCPATLRSKHTQTVDQAHSKEITIQEAAKPQNVVPPELIPEGPKQWRFGMCCPTCGWHLEVHVRDMGGKQICPHCHVEITPVIQMKGRSETQCGAVERAVYKEGATGGEWLQNARQRDYSAYHASVGQRVSSLLKECPSSDDFFWLSIARAAHLVNVTKESKINIGLAREIARNIENAGYCVEPDARFGSGSYDWNQTLAIFKPCQNDSKEPSPAYLGAANLLRLCVPIAAADGQIDDVELDVYRQVIENQLNLSQTDHRRLLALERLLTQDPSSASRILAKVAKSVPSHKRQLIGKVLVRVASADHVVTKAEFRVLERIFKAFELPSDTLVKLVGQVGRTLREPTRVGSIAPQAFALDMARVHAIATETKEVVRILSVVMEDEEPETQTPPSVTTVSAPETSPALCHDTTTPAGKQFDGLDVAFHSILERLLARDSWPQSDFHALAREFHFMPLNIHDTINEWADEELGDLLLEGEDPIVVRRELIMKERK